MTTLRTVRRQLVPTVALASLAVATAAHAIPGDWPQWRGPARDGISTETGWSSAGRDENVWATSVGLGYSSFAMHDGRLYTMGFDKEKEHDTVFCLDAATGKPIWTHSYPAKIWDRMHGGGTLTTPSIDGDALYTLNREGRFFRFKADDGEVVWSRNLVDELEVTPPTWGFSASPLVLDDMLVLNVGVIVALDKTTGKTLWKSRDLGHAYSTPATLKVQGRPSLAVFNGAGMALLDRRSGEEMGFHEWKTMYEINAATPVIVGDDKVFISSGLNRGCGMVKCSPDGIEVLWESKVMRTKMSGCVLISEHLYGFDDSMLKCIDLEGNEKWRARGVGDGSLMAADGRLIVIGAKGELIIAAADPGEYKELSRTKCLSGGVYWTMPVLVDGLIYCRSSEGSIVCRDHRPKASALREVIAESPHIPRNPNDNKPLPQRTRMHGRLPSLLALLGFAGLAHGQAQAPPEPMPVEESTAEESATTDAASKETTVRLPPVVVTARRWEENLLEVPQSVSVIPESLIQDAGIRDMRDTAVYVPNVYFTEFSAQRLSFPFIRGIGSGQGDPAVTTYIDGVPQLAISSTNLPLLDVERIEFLRGPQGTLYGRNSLGGLMHVITKRPSNTTEFELGSTFGNYGLQEYRLRFSGPIVEDELFVSLSGMRMTRDGYTENDFTRNDVDDRDVWFGRADVLWTPDERNDVRFSVYGEDRNDGGFVLSELNGLKRRPHHIFQDFEGRTDRDLVQPSLTWTHAGDMIEFTTISAFQTWDIDESSDFDFSALDGVRRFTDESLDGFTQEVRISSAEDAPLEISDEIELKWLAGVLAFTADSDRSATNEFRPGGVPFLSPVPGRDRSSGDFDEDAIGVFGQATVTIAQNLDLTAGLRYDYESKDVDITRTFSSGGFTMPLGAADEDKSFDEFLPRFDVAYRFGEQVTVYGLAAKGFKAGGFNLSAPPGELAFDTETSWTYEGGIKTSFLDDRLRLSAAYFYIDWDDMQLSQFDAMSGGYVTNAGESTSQGVEFELSTRPVEGLDVFATFGYTDTDFDKFVDSYGVDVSGNDLPFAPDTTWSVGAQYSGALGRSVNFFVRGEYLDVGELFYDAGNRENERFAIANFSAGVSGPNWRLQGWVRNALQDDYVPVAFQPSPVDPSLFVGESGAPRTYGVTLSLTF